MRVHILSDIHLEDGDYDAAPVDADVVVLAGDIGVGVEGVKWAKKSFDVPVIYVAGNHEFHDNLFTMDQHVEAMKEAVKDSDVVVLDNDTVVIDGVRFLGTTLWTKLDAGDDLLYCDQNVMVDRDEYLTSSYTNKLYNDGCSFLKNEISKPFDGLSVVVTHHAPSFQSIHEDYVGNVSNNRCYVSDLEYIMNGVDAWVHGHTHHNFDYKIKDTRVVCNPAGYLDDHARENTLFNSSLVLDL